MPNETPLTNSDFSNLAEIRSKIYSFLSMNFIGPPDKDFLRTAANKGFDSLLTSLTQRRGNLEEIREGLELLSNFVRKSKGKTLEEISRELSVEYTRLFRGVKQFYGPPPPYESVYREGFVMGESTVEVSREYQEVGVGLPIKYKGEPPDHISFELDFMRFLCNKEREAWKNHDKKEALKIIKKQGRFLNDHLAQWVPSFCEKVVSESRTDFYRALAMITKIFLGIEQNQIDSFLQLERNE